MMKFKTVVLCFKLLTCLIVQRSFGKNIFAKGYSPNWSEEGFVISKIKNTVPWTYFISDLNGENIVETFCEKELQKQLKKKLG